MREEVLSPTFNPHLENFLHRQDSYSISKKNISTAPKACSEEDSYIKSSLLSCHNLAQLPLLFSFPVLMDSFLALLADMRKSAGKPVAFPSCSYSRDFSHLCLGVARQELHLFGGVLRHAMQMSGEGDSSECYRSGQTKSHNPRII